MIRALVFTLLAAATAAAQVRHAPGTSRIDLNRNWEIQSSAKVAADGAGISITRFHPDGWFHTAVPSTVVATLVDHDKLPDPNFGMNLRSFPGLDYFIGDNFSNRPMSPDSPFAVSWWYRTAFKFPAVTGERRVWLNFDSINYSANIWLNGRQIATRDQARGMYRRFEFDVTDAILPGANALAVEIFAPTENDFTITFVDWNPMPPDKDMGLVDNVYLRTSGPVTIRHPQVVSKVDSTLDQAHLTLFADLKNAGGRDIDGTLRGTIGNISIAQPVRLAAGESRRIRLDPAAFPQLNIRDPQLWWPYGLGPQNLQLLQLEFETAGVVSDRQTVPFGIREFTSGLDAQQHRVFRINGRRILIRGGGWTQNMLLRVDDQREEAEILYARDMHLNTIRLEGKLMNDHFFETADRLGMMVMPGWCCCSYFEQWDRWTPDDYWIVTESLRDQLRRLRNYAGVFVFLYSSDESPTPPAEQAFLKVIAEENWPHTYISSATDRNTPGAGHTGVKMTGPYDYVAPNYWLLDTQRGGASGFITETSPGAAIPVLSSLQQMLPKDHLWPIDDFWTFHAGGGCCTDVSIFTAAMDGRYGPAADLQDYVRKAQVMAYEGERAMFEAYGRNKYTATGVIQWMLNNSWPSLIWHLYDFYLRPGGGYFGTKKANEPLHVQYSYDDRSIAVVNSLYRSFPGHTVTAKVYNLDLTEKYSRTSRIDIADDSSTRVFTLPEIADLTRTYFVRLALDDPDGKRVSSNFYWLSTQPDVYDWAASSNIVTPISRYGDLTDLANLPPARVSLALRSEDNGSDRIDHITVRNVSGTLAFSIHLTVLKGGDGSDIAPVYWEDNYFELMPGEEREVAAVYPLRLLGGAPSRIQVDGWNVAATSN